MGYSGNNINADGIRLGWQVFGCCHPDLFINDPSAALRTGQPAGSAPDPSSGISASISLLYSGLPDTASFPGMCRLGIRSLSWLLSGTGGSALL